ncbi:MAG: LPS assembly lipoprotein LptE [Thiohalobacterales bacterium]|nr:LPS assembly lipoprotein LptE [Thiohalobacterales bacterium]
MKAHSVYSRISVLLLAGIMLAGCGYQLRGSASLPQVMSVTYIQGMRPYSELVTDFSRALSTRNIEVTTDADSATAILTISGNNFEKLVQSVDSAGNVLEYEIRQTISFSVSDPDRKVLLPEQSLTLSRDFLYTSTDVLAKAREEKLVRRTLQKNLVSLAMLRIAALENK